MVGPDIGIEEGGAPYKFREYCERLGMSPGICSRIDFRGSLPLEHVWRLRSQAAVTVVASRYENFPYAAMESLLVGSPTVFSKTGGIPEILSDGVTGISFQPGNWNDLAEKLEVCISNPASLVEWSENALRDAGRFHPDAIFQQFTTHYSSKK